MPAMSEDGPSGTKTAPTDPAPPRKQDVSRRARSAARLNGVQALYQMEMTGAAWREIAEEFRDHRAVQEIDDEELAKADRKHFRKLLEGAVGEQTRIDRATDGVMKSGWPLKRIDPTLRALFRAAGSEFLTMPKVPHKVVINEYVEVAKAFFEGEEARFANAVLDALSRELRPVAPPATPEPAPEA